MPSLTVLLSDLSQPVGLCADPNGTRVLVALRGGQLTGVDLATAQQTVLAQLPGRISGFAVAPDGQRAYVAGNSMGLWEAPLDGSAPVRLIRSLRTPKAIAVDPTGQLVFVAEGRIDGRLLQLDLANAQLSVVELGLQRPRGMVYETSANRPIIAEQLGGQLVVPDPTGPPIVLATGLGEPVDLAWHDAEQSHLLVADTAGGRVVSVDRRQPANPPVELVSGLDQLRGAQPVGAATLALLTGSTLSIMDLPPVVHEPVEVTIPAGELFIAGWVRAGVNINDPTVVFDDIDFIIEPRESGALVSNSRDNGFDAGAPTIVVSAGWRAGMHELIALSRVDGSELGRTSFEVLDTWTHPTLGPSIATFGTVNSGPDEGTWGGPDSGDFSVPQNVPKEPKVGTRRLAVVLVETASANGQYPTGAALTTITNDLRDELVNGVTVNGQVRSLVDYYATASDGKLTVDVVGPVGPVALPNGFGSYFTMDSSGKWLYDEDTDSSIIAEIVALNEAAAANGDPPFLDLSQIDSVMYVVRSVTAMPPAADRFVWPRASRSSKMHIIGHIELNVFGTTLSLPVPHALYRIFMPDDWAARDGNRLFHETASHEFGHNLGLRDQYNKSYAAAIADRITAQDPPGGGARWTWELMSWEQDLPMPSAAHRLMLGWLDPAKVKLFNFGTSGAADEEVVLHAVADGPPAAGSGEFAAIEVRLEDGLNYYFEYRPAVAGVIADSNSPEASAVLGTEALTRTPEPKDRAQILLVEDDADAIDEEGSFITSQDFKDKDTSSPGFENDFIVDVLSTNATTARVRVRYAADNKPDPGMTPWSPSSNWQSPDIEVVNARSLSDSSYRNIPWEGHDNWVRATVSNRGLSDAHGVTVDFFAKDFTFGGGAETGLGAQTLDVPIGPPVVFTSPNTWRPPQVWFPFGNLSYKQHACFGGRFGPFQDPVTNIWEVTTENNEAQSNYTWMASSSHSPATREVTTIWADNPFDKPAVISFSINQPHPMFRVYLDHRWVYLQPGERQRILLMVESLLGDQRFEELSEAFLHERRMIETKLRLSASGDTGDSCAESVIGGVAVRVVTGYGTEFEYFEAHGDGGGWATGRVIRTDNRQGASGTVLISVMPYDLEDPTPEVVVEAQLDYDGYFSLEFSRPELRGRAQASFLGWYALAPCESEVVEL